MSSFILYESEFEAAESLTAECGAVEARYLIVKDGRCPTQDNTGLNERWLRLGDSDKDTYLDISSERRGGSASVRCLTLN